MGWSFPWASAFGSDFNDDFDVSVAEEQERSGTFGYVRAPSGTTRTLGRNEAREDGDPLNFFRRHDEYDAG